MVNGKSAGAELTAFSLEFILLILDQHQYWIRTLLLENTSHTGKDQLKDSKVPNIPLAVKFVTSNLRIGNSPISPNYSIR